MACRIYRPPSRWRRRTSARSRMRYGRREAPSIPPMSSQPKGLPLGINLRTVVRQGKRGADDNWTWIVKTIENRTLDSPWHTVPSIAVDHQNFVHVAYNMHNMPWQYSVSRQPGSLDAFDFRGEAFSLFRARRCPVPEPDTLSRSRQRSDPRHADHLPDILYGSQRRSLGHLSVCPQTQSRLVRANLWVRYRPIRFSPPVVDGCRREGPGRSQRCFPRQFEQRRRRRHRILLQSRLVGQ